MYDRDWFKKRAINSLVKQSNGVWDYTDSLLLYSPQGQEAYESAQGDHLPYFKLVTKPEHHHLKSIVREIAEILPTEFEYIDLGPGTENKELYFFEEFRRQEKKFVYVPVDVSSYFLDKSKTNAEGQGLVVRPIQTSFEELGKVLGESTIPRFVTMLGLTFSNYLHTTALKLLKEIVGTNGSILFDMQLAERVDLDELQMIYQKYVSPACDEKIRLLDLSPEFDVTERIADQKIEITCELRKVTPPMKEKGMEVGDRLILFRSNRISMGELEYQLKGLNYTLLDKGQSFVSVLLEA